MHLLLGDTSRMFRSVSTVFGLPRSRVWWGMIRCHLFFLIYRTSDAILGHIPFQRIFMDLRKCHMFEDRWFHAIWSPTYHTFRCHIGAYFRSDEIYISWGSCVLILIHEMYVEMMMYSLSSRWFLSGAYREPSSQARAFRCLDVAMLPSERRLFDMWVCFSCRHRWFELIWFFDMLHFRCHTRENSPSWSRFIDPH